MKSLKPNFTRFPCLFIALSQHYLPPSLPPSLPQQRHKREHASNKLIHLNLLRLLFGQQVAAQLHELMGKFEATDASVGGKADQEALMGLMGKLTAFADRSASAIRHSYSSPLACPSGARSLFTCFITLPPLILSLSLALFLRHIRPILSASALCPCLCLWICLCLCPLRARALSHTLCLCPFSCLCPRPRPLLFPLPLPMPSAVNSARAASKRWPKSQNNSEGTSRENWRRKGYSGKKSTRPPPTHSRRLTSLPPVFLVHFVHIIVYSKNGISHSHPTPSPPVVFPSWTALRRNRLPAFELACSGLSYRPRAKQRLAALCSVASPTTASPATSRQQRAHAH